MKKKQKLNRKVKHHIIPKSRGGKDTPENILRVNDKFHRAYHLLFANKVQHEIIEYLINFWFKGRVTRNTLKLFEKYLERRCYYGAKMGSVNQGC